MGVLCCAECITDMQVQWQRQGCGRAFQVMMKRRLVRLGSTFYQRLVAGKDQPHALLILCP